MEPPLERCIGILESLVGFDSVSARPNQPIVGFITDLLARHGIECSLSHDETGERANVFATIGEPRDGGVVLSGHTDVVPVEGQDWETDPFRLTRSNGKLIGRGAVDMKGFIACALACVPQWQALDLKRPIHLAFSFDEEIGGIGMPHLLKDMGGKPFRPAAVIVGEPTQMKIVSGHKGGYELRTDVTGLEVHSCNPLQGVSAISYAVRLIARIEELAARHAANPHAGSPYEPPYTTFNIGTIAGGSARNATAGSCSFGWEIRPLPGEDGRSIIAEVEEFAARELVPSMRRTHADADIRIVIEAPVPPLDDRNAADAVALVRELTGLNSEEVVSFGTDGGYFSDDGYSTVVFGPGDIMRAHKPGEFILERELASGLDFLLKLGERLAR